VIFRDLNVSQRQQFGATQFGQPSASRSDRGAQTLQISQSQKEILMNTKHIITAVAFALVGASAFASEVTEFKDTPSTLSRATVKAELARAQAAGELKGASEIYGSFESAPVSIRSRAEVRAEAVKAAHERSVNMLYVGA
jgi:hypothetical protein